MANSEDYVLIWAGMRRDLAQDEIKQVQAGTHPLIEQSRKLQMDYWVDSFADTPAGEPLFSLLLGKRVGLLGYKEGRTELSMRLEDLAEMVDRIRPALATLALSEPTRLHILLRIQE